MTVYRTLLLAALIVATPLCAGAQVGDGQGELPGGSLTSPPAPPPACQQLLALHDEVQKHGMSIQKANQRRATDKEACKLFRNFLGAEAKFIKSLEENIRTCGFPGDAIKQANERHAETEQVGKQICEAAGLSLTPGSTGDFGWLGARMPGR